MKYSLSKSYKRDIKKLPSEVLSSPELIEVLYCIFKQKPLPAQYKDHALTGNWQGFRDCHVKNDLVLVYRMVDGKLQLARLNTHSEVFG